jgi:hypothetical protein
MTFGSLTETDLSQESDSESFTNFDFTNTTNSASSREVFADLSDGVTYPEFYGNTTYHQIYVITGAGREADKESETFDDLGNPYVDPADLTRGTGSKYIGAEPREKVQLPQEACDRATRGMSGTKPMATQCSATMLQAYQYKLSRSRHELEKLQKKLDERRAAADASSDRRGILSEHSRNSVDNQR